MTLQYVAKSISNFKPAKFIHVRTGAHSSVEAFAANSILADYFVKAPFKSELRWILNRVWRSMR